MVSHSTVEMVEAEWKARYEALKQELARKNASELEAAQTITELRKSLGAFQQAVGRDVEYIDADGLVKAFINEQDRLNETITELRDDLARKADRVLELSRQLAAARDFHEAAQAGAEAFLAKTSFADSRAHSAGAIARLMEDYAHLRLAAAREALEEAAQVVKTFPLTATDRLLRFRYEGLLLTVSDALRSLSRPTEDAKQEDGNGER